MSFNPLARILGLEFHMPALKPGPELLDGERLDVVRRRTERMRPLNVTRMLGTAQHSDVEWRLKVAIANPGENFKTRERGNLEIKKDEVGMGRRAIEHGLQVLNGRGAVDRVHDVTVESALIQRPAKEKGVILRVFDEEDEWT